MAQGAHRRLPPLGIPGQRLPYPLVPKLLDDLQLPAHVAKLPLLEDLPLLAHEAKLLALQLRRPLLVSEPRLLVLLLPLARRLRRLRPLVDQVRRRLEDLLLPRSPREARALQQFWPDLRT